jgi:hypothetical protein
MTRSRRAFLGSLFCSTVAVLIAPVGQARADTVYYDSGGNTVVINVYNLSGPVVVYDVYRRPITVYPAHPGYVPAPAVRGPASVRGQTRRVARRTTRRTYRRLN